MVEPYILGMITGLLIGYLFIPQAKFVSDWWKGRSYSSTERRCARKKADLLSPARTLAEGESAGPDEEEFVALGILTETTRSWLRKRTVVIDYGSGTGGITMRNQSTLLGIVVSKMLGYDRFAKIVGLPAKA